MNRQSEHLSEADIEQYGETGSSTESEAAVRRDRIEAHLADCSACSERVLASQRVRLALLAASPVTPAQGADRRDPDRPGLPPAATGQASADHRTLDCPDEDDLRHLAAGLFSPDQATKLTHHAAQCDHCGPLLRTFVEDFSEELSGDDQAVLGNLKSSSAAWQKKLVRAMASGAVGSSATKSKRPFPWRWAIAPTALAACGLIVFGIWYSQRDTPEKVEKLLAQAYTEQRQLEMRIPYAQHVEFHQLRSGNAGSLLSSPEALRKATNAIGSHLKTNPDDPKWLLLSARLNLLDWRYRSAFSTLNRIDDDKILDTSDYRLTLALAEYEKAEAEQDPQSYGNAVDLLGKVLQKSPDDPVALFNQAVACEKLYMYGCATNDYEHLLTIDASSGWSNEARDHLKSIEEKKSPDR